MCHLCTDDYQLYPSEPEAFIVNYFLICERSESQTETPKHGKVHLRGETVENGISRYLLHGFVVTSSRFLPCSRGTECVDVELQLVNIARCVCVLREILQFSLGHRAGTHPAYNTTRAEREDVGGPREQEHERGAVGELRREPHPGELTC